MPRSRRKLPVVPVLVLLCLAIVFISVVVVAYYQSLLQPVDPSSQEQIAFSIEKGESIDQISTKLTSQKLIREALVFKMYLKYNNLGTTIQAGDFSLSKAMSVPELAQALSKSRSKQINITILEGWRVEEVAQELEKQFLAAGIPFSAQVFLKMPQVQEGRIFPDTYFFSLTTNEQTVAKTIEANFNQKLETIKLDIEASTYSLDEILTMASIIEREARTDRAIVSGILWKRIENDWPLQADATLQYAKGYNSTTNEWWTPPLAADKEIVSPYNSYANLGLPPGPIANPSLSSIEAAASPIETEYWFYITDLQGNMHYGETLDEHNRNINRYLK